MASTYPEIGLVDPGAAAPVGTRCALSLTRLRLPSHLPESRHYLVQQIRRPMSSPPPYPLRRSRTDNVIGGVIGGIAHYFQLSATNSRIAFVVVSILSAGFPGILVYLALWFVIPRDK
jgi:phage shock protein PspC (stress-responsive transcriptional regulator)